MRIDGTYIAPNGLPEAVPPAGKGVKGGPASASTSKPGQDFQAPPNPYIQKAAACEDVSTQAVAEARELLAQGKLDSVEFLQRAAQSILDLGI